MGQCAVPVAPVRRVVETGGSGGERRGGAAAAVAADARAGGSLAVTMATRVNRVAATMAPPHERSKLVPHHSMRWAALWDPHPHVYAVIHIVSPPSKKMALLPTQAVKMPAASTWRWQSWCGVVWW